MPLIPSPLSYRTSIHPHFLIQTFLLILLILLLLPFQIFPSYSGVSFFSFLEQSPLLDLLLPLQLPLSADQPALPGLTFFQNRSLHLKMSLYRHHSPVTHTSLTRHCRCRFPLRKNCYPFPAGLAAPVPAYIPAYHPVLFPIT